MHYLLIKIFKTRNREYGGRKFSMAKGFRGFLNVAGGIFKETFHDFVTSKKYLGGCGELARFQPNGQLQHGLVYP